jgi:small-conductance mechanosensitive channel
MFTEEYLKKYNIELIQIISESTLAPIILIKFKDGSSISYKTNYTTIEDEEDQIKSEIHKSILEKINKQRIKKLKRILK